MSIWENLATESYVDNHEWVAADITDFAASVTAFTLNQLAIPTANLNLNGFKIINLLDPTSNQDAATKKYVDDSIIAAPIPTITLTKNVTGVSDITGSIETSLNSTQVMATSYLKWSFADDNPSKNANMTFNLAGGSSDSGSFTMEFSRETYPDDRGWMFNIGTGTQTSSEPFFQLYCFNNASAFTFIPYRAERFSDGSLRTTINGPVQLNELTATTVVGVDSNKRIASINYSTSNTASALVQRDSDNQIACDKINMFYNGTSSSSTNTPIVDITNSNNCFGGMKVRLGNANGRIGSRFSGYVASGDWFYFTYNIAISNSGTVSYDNGSHRTSAFYFSQTEFHFAVSISAAAVPVDRLIIDGSGNTIKPATNNLMSLGTSSLNFSALFVSQITFPTSASIRKALVLGDYIGNNFQFYGMGVTAGKLAFNTQSSGTGFEWCYGTASSTVQLVELLTSGFYLREGSFHGRKISGSYFVSTPSATNFTSGNWIKVGGTTTAVNLNGFTHSNNRITNNTGRTIIVRVSFHASVIASTTTTPFFLTSVVKNGSTAYSDEYNSTWQTTTVNTSNYVNISSQGLMTLSNGDYLEVYGNSLSVTNSVTFQSLNLTVHEE